MIIYHNLGELVTNQIKQDRTKKKKERGNWQRKTSNRMQRWAKHGKSMKLLDFIYHTGRCEPCVKTNETKIKLYSKKYHVSMRKIGYF